MKWTSFIHLKEITKMINKKRINNCNQLTKSTFKGANDYDKHKIYFNKEKEKFINK